MANFHIPVFPPLMPMPEHDFPITQRENLMMAFRHEKPYYMPCTYQATQWVWPKAFTICCNNMVSTEECIDWFGIHYKYEAVQTSTTPIPPFPLDGIENWRDIPWPSVYDYDWEEDFPQFVRDETRALGMRTFGNGTFEQLHFIEGFEQCLIDIISEPEECRAFFEKLTDLKEDMFKVQNDLYHYDFACHNDDWSNAKSQFFSTEIFEQTLLEPAVRLSEYVKKTGCAYMVHICGKMEVWLPYIVDDIKADLIEIQSINNIDGIIDTYGDRVTVEYMPDPYIMYNPETTVEQVREYARSIVDRFGAHKNKGSGIALFLIGGTIPDIYYAFEDEIYNYSRKCYADLH